MSLNSLLDCGVAYGIKYLVDIDNVKCIELRISSRVLHY